jgi:3-phosphoshikimate 1-carboxyvinyltransferase
VGAAQLEPAWQRLYNSGAVPLPEFIEIEPLTQPVCADVRAPGSKSITNRALVLAALGNQTITLTGALWSEDTQVMIDCLGRLGFELSVEPDAEERSNRTIRVRGMGGKIPKGGTRAAPLELFVGNAGTAARFLTALVCLGQGFYRLSGVARMHERPQGALFRALRELGYHVQSFNDRLPALVEGQGPKRGKCRVSLVESSQFASALLMAGKIGGWEVEVTGENAEESPYVAMTSTLMEQFERAREVFPIEPDSSSASYLWAAGWLLKRDPKTAASRISVQQWPAEFLQVDTWFPKRIEPDLPAQISRQNELGDSIMTAIVIAPFANKPVRFTDLGRLRVQECERVAALRTELGKCGARVHEIGDTLEVFPGPLHGAEIETYNDHRMAMCFATLGLKVAGIKIKNPGCVKKTFPDFFEKLAAAPPHGLGAVIKDASGRVLRGEELLAE